MNLSRPAIHRPIFTTMVTLIVVLLGLISLNRLPIDLMPDITNPTLTVFSTYGNASPEEMEELITKPIEEAVSAVPGVQEVTSVSAEGISNIRVTFTWGTDLDAAANDVRDRLDRAAPRLPDDAERPTLLKFDLAAFPILILGAYSRLDPIQAQRILDDQIKPRMERLPGVASFESWGGLQREIHVDVNLDKVRALGLGLDQVVAQVQAANVNLPSGSIERGLHEITIRTPGEYGSLDELRETVVAVRGGATVRLRDIAIIEDSWRRIRQIVRVNGEPGTRLAIMKQSGANTVEVARRALAELEKIAVDIPQVRIVPIIDTSDYIRRSISNLGSSAMWGGALAVIVLFLFLRNVRSTAVIAIAIPVSIVASFTLMQFSGFTLNIMTLGALALAVGMLVDNAIVVLENIFRLRESGMGQEEAAVEGSSEVTAAIVSSTLTTLAVFLPLVFVRGMAGVMFKQLAMVVSFSLTCSLIAAMTLVPMLAARIPARAVHAESRWALLQAIGRVLKAMEHRYSGLLRLTLKHRTITIVAAVLLLAGSVALVSQVGVEFMPSTDESDVRVNVEMDVGTRLDLLSDRMRRVEETVRRLVPEARSMVMSIGGSRWRPGASHMADIRIALVPVSQRKESSEQIAARLRQALGQPPGLRIRTRAGEGLFILRMAAGGSEKLQVEIRGHDPTTADALAQRVKTEIEAVEGVTDTQVSRVSGRPEETVRIDRQRAADLGLSVSQIATTLETVLSGTRAGYYREAGKEYEIMVRSPRPERLDRADLLNLTLINARGEPVLLRNVVDLDPRSGPVMVERKDQQRVVTVSANISGRDLGSIASDAAARLREIPTPRDFSLTLAGDIEEQQKSFRELLFSFGLALILVYMVMACQYESLRDPFVVMFSVPFAAIGVILMLFLTHTTFNVQSYIGCIMLGGIVVNNAILLVDHTNLLRRRDGMPLREAIEEAGRRRLRPILMTTLTTALGLLPLAIGLGDGGEAQAPLARAVIGGLASSTLITLIFVPVMYEVFEELGRRRSRNRGVANGTTVALLLAAAAVLAVPATTSAQTPTQPNPALMLSIPDAVMLALENNREVAVSRLTPRIRATTVEEQRAAFDPVLKGEASWQRTDAMRLSVNDPGVESVDSGQTQTKAAVEAALPTGTRVAVETSGATVDSSLYSRDLSSTRAGITVSQALLNGRGLDVNLASLRQAKLDAQMSEYELRGLIESLVARVERTCWDYALAGRHLLIREESVRLAEQLRAETAERIRLGQLAETELASAEAEIALRREDVINATSSLAATRLRLLRLLNPPGAGLWDRPMYVRTPTNMAEVAADAVEDHVRVALRYRPDLNQARLLAWRNELEVVRTRNGLLPRLDLFLTLGGTGYARSLAEAPTGDLGDGSDVLLGLRAEYPIGNRQAEARHERARLSREQALQSIQNLQQAVEVDVRTAVLEVERARAQVTATEATRKRQEEKRRAEVEKYRVGRSTSLLVAQTERDMLQSRLAEVQAMAGCFKAIVELHRLDGSLLERRGLVAPGRQPPSDLDLR